MSNPPASDERPTVLVVDDDPETADLYADYLAGEYTVLTAYSGAEATDTLAPSVDVVLLDRMMPGMSGDEVLERIRARDAEYRVVYVTAITPDIDVIDLPFDEYLTKPVDKGTLRDAVERMLRRNGYDDQLMEAVTLASRMATLESKLSIQDLEASDRYASYRRRLTRLREETGIDEFDDDIYAELMTEKIQVLLD